jgi:hypothetical protein
VVCVKHGRYMSVQIHLGITQARLLLRCLFHILVRRTGSTKQDPITLDVSMTWENMDN